MNSDHCLCCQWFIVNSLCQEYDSTLEQSEGCDAVADAGVAKVRLIIVNVEIKKAETNDILKEELWTEISPYV